MWDPYAEFERIVLPNNLTLHTLNLVNRPWIKVRIIVHIGGERDPVGKEGLAHFVEHMTSGNGSLSVDEIQRRFQKLGGEVGLGVTSPRATWYDFTVPNDPKLIVWALDLFGDMLLHARLEDGIEHERKVIVAEFHRKYPFNFDYERKLFHRRSLYPGLWQSRMTSNLGTLESLSTITQDDLQSHYDTYYSPANMEIVCVGGILPEDFSRLVRDSQFGIEKQGTRSPRPMALSETPIPTVLQQSLSVSQFTSTIVESATYSSWCLVPGTVNSTAVYLVREMLDEMLFEAIRSKLGLVYSIGTEGYNFRSLYELGIGSRGIEPRNLATVVSEVERVIDSLDQEDLLSRKKEEEVSRLHMIDPSGGTLRNNAAENLIEGGRITSLAEDVSEIERISIEDVRRVAGYLHSSRRFTVLWTP